MPKLDGTQMYDYTMDQLAASRGGQSSNQPNASNGYQSRLTMRQVGDPAVFGRSRLSSGSPACGASCSGSAPLKAVAAPQCQMWSGYFQDSGQQSLKEIDMSAMFMKPTTWSTGYHGMDTTLNLPSRMIASVASNRQYEACKGTGVSKGHYGSYGPPR
jgi:hypothetical protein